MAATPDHGSLDQDLQGIHVPFQFKFPTEASRLAAVTADVADGASKFALQEDTSSVWLLFETDPAPTWASLATGAALGETNTGANLGTGIEVFRGKSGAVLNFRSLIAGTNMTVSSATSDITIAATGADTAANLGTGIEIFREKSGNTLNLRSLIGGTNITISSATSAITLSTITTGSEAVTEAVNLGTGIESFREKSGASLTFRTLVAGTNVTISSATSIVTIAAGAATAGSEAVTEGANIGTGIEVYREKSGASLMYRTLVAGNDITISSATSTVTITSTATGGGAAASPGHFSVTIGASDTWENELIPVWQAPRDGSATIVEILSTTSGVGADPELSFNLQHRDWDAMQDSGEDIWGASQTATSAGEQSQSFDRTTVDPKAHLMFSTGSGAETGTVKYVQLTVYYTL